MVGLITVYHKGGNPMRKLVEKHTKCDTRGLTLIEVVVSVALLAIVSLMLVTCISVSLGAVRTTRHRNNDADSAAGKIEAQRASSATGTSSSMTITFNGTQYTVSGSYTTGNNGSITYHEFVPNP